MRNLRLNRNSEETIMTFSITSHRLGRRHDYVGRRHQHDENQRGEQHKAPCDRNSEQQAIASHNKWLTLS